MLNNDSKILVFWCNGQRKEAVVADKKHLNVCLLLQVIIAPGCCCCYCNALVCAHFFFLEFNEQITNKNNILEDIIIQVCTNIYLKLNYFLML